MNQAGDTDLRQDLSFVYRIRRQLAGSDETLVLLHGSGVDETTMMPLGTSIAPGATLIAVRGRVMQEGSRRWFTRITPTRFGQGSIRAEVHAFDRFLHELGEAEGLDAKRAVFIGYSNGANLLSSLMLLRPGRVRRAVLLRAMPVLTRAPDADLSAASVLILAGARDETYGPFAPALADLLRSRKAAVTARTVAAGHEFGPEDAEHVRAWLRPEAAGLAKLPNSF